MARKKDGTTAYAIFSALDHVLMVGAVAQILTDGGAVMFGQTRDNEKLIITVYINGEREVEYCEDVEDAEKHLAAYRV